MNGQQYQAIGKLADNGNIVFNGDFANGAPTYVQPLTRYGNLPPEITAEGGTRAPVFTLGQDGIGHLIQLNYNVGGS